MDLLGYDKVKITIERIKQFEPPEGYFLAFSGGKDSVVLERLADIAEVSYQCYFSQTTVDPPELLDFINNKYNGVHWLKPKQSMWKLVIYNKFPPTRLMRYCCAELKECHGSGRLLLTGIRSQESNTRKKRQMVEQCRTDPRKRYVHPIIDWTEEEVWEFIQEHKLPYCDLYKDPDYPKSEHWELPELNNSFNRIGCVMCPMGSKKQRAFEAKRFPNFYRAWLRTFDKLIELYPDNYTTFKSGRDIMNWWLSDKGINDLSEGLFE
jgi:phosphoadenosine phosphosulfate reductase